MNLEDFKNIPSNMIWKSSAIEQINNFGTVCAKLGLPFEVVGSHTSKSIKLPVIRITCPEFAVYMRDNFHDVNICVVSQKQITLSFSELFDGVLESHNWDWYLENIQRCRSYSWKEWTDEQMDDPTILKPSPDAHEFLCKTTDQKLRWIKRMTDPEWYTRDWSSGVISYEGEFGPDAKLWIQDRPFMQGIEDLVPDSAHCPYAPGCKEFALALDYRAGTIIQRLMEHTKS